MGLDLGELRERSPAGVVAPHPEARGEPGILPRTYPRVVLVPLPGMHDDAVAHGDVRDCLADRVHHTRGVGSDDVEVGGLAPPRLSLRDIHRESPRRPDVVVVHARSHHQHEGVVRAELGNRDDLVLDRGGRVTVAVGPHQLRVHGGRDLADRGDLADLIQLLAHARHPLRVSDGTGEP